MSERNDAPCCEKHGLEKLVQELGNDAPVAAQAPTNDMVKAPWTEEQVASLNRFQQSRRLHPFTCGSGKRGDEQHLDGEGILLATPNGWVCRFCDYRQSYAYRVMFTIADTPDPFASLVMSRAAKDPFTKACLLWDEYRATKESDVSRQGDLIAALDDVLVWPSPVPMGAPAPDELTSSSRPSTLAEIIARAQAPQPPQQFAPAVVWKPETVNAFMRAWSDRAELLAMFVGAPARGLSETQNETIAWWHTLVDAHAEVENCPDPEGCENAKIAIGIIDTLTAQLAEAERQRDEATWERAEANDNYHGACKTIADMHAAAVGEITGPRRGVVEDIADVRGELTALRAERDTAIAQLAETATDLEEYLAEKRRLAREIDVALNGEAGAAQQASLCDLVGPARDLRRERDAARATIAEAERLRDALPEEVVALLPLFHGSGTEAQRGAITAAVAMGRRLTAERDTLRGEHDRLVGLVEQECRWDGGFLCECEKNDDGIPDFTCDAHVLLAKIEARAALTPTAPQ